MPLPRLITRRAACARSAGLLLWAGPALPAQAAEPPGTLRFDFTDHPAPGAVPVRWQAPATAPAFDAARGHGFVEETLALPPRPVQRAEIRSTAAGAVVQVAALDLADGAEHANGRGLAFRVQLPPGSYALHVRTTSSEADTSVAFSGLQSSRLRSAQPWDAAGRVARRQRLRVDGRDWHFEFVSGRPFIDIEVEARRAGVEVGLAAVDITPLALPVPAAAAGEPPTLFILGDSTVKSYTFEEAPMSGWGQVLPRLFDTQRLRIVNYAMGGRSYRNAYAEGRFNDLLLASRPGDAVLIQFGHNDESADERKRWGRGSTEAQFEALVREVYLPALKSRGLQPILVTPMARVPGALRPGEAYADSFQTRRFPAVVRRLGAALQLPVVDLNARSVAYYNETGEAAITAMVMAIEAGETPGKTNNGSYANGHPAEKIDGTHFREALAKQYARLVAEELVRLASSGHRAPALLTQALQPAVRAAIASGDWQAVYPEIAPDITRGANAYYRPQIEKLLQLGVLDVDAEGRFQPQAPMQTAAFVAALTATLRLPDAGWAADAPGATPLPLQGALQRETMAVLLHRAYRARFAQPPLYMTAYNGRTVVPSADGHDPNLDAGARGAMYHPLLPWDRLADLPTLTPAWRAEVQAAYEAGLLRAEDGIARGRMVNGRLLQPQQGVTRAQAAKALYFIWVLAQPVNAENHRLDADR